MRNREFGRLLSQAIKCIAAREDRTVESVEQAIGDILGFSLHTVQRWRRGYIPEPEVVNHLVEIAVRRGNMPPTWVRSFLAQARHPQPDRLIESLAGQYGHICQFLDDRFVPRAEIFRQAQKYVLQAERRVWVLNSHPGEPLLEESLIEMQTGTLDHRVFALEKLVTQHAYYEQLIRQATSIPGQFEYVRIVQIPEDKHPEISPETTGYHYLYHFYQMLKERETSWRPGREINVLLYAGSLLRNTTFAVVDDHTLLIQITGLRRQSTGDVAYELRGLLVIQSEAHPSVVTQFADLFDYIRKGHEGQITNVTLEDLERFRDQIPALEDVIAGPLDGLLEDLWEAERFDDFNRVARTVFGSHLPPLQRVLMDLMPKYEQRPQWPLVLNALRTADPELYEVLSQRPVEITPLKPRAYALVVGISIYQNLPRLALATKDAADLRHTLVSSGYEPQDVVLLLDNAASRSTISQALDQISRRARPEDLVFIFFSGHGAQRVGGLEPGEYLCPVETDLQNLRLTAISGEEFTKALNSIKAKRVMVCLDACHAGGAGQLKDGELSVQLDLPPQVYARWAGEGRVILASSGPDDLSWELPRMGNGLFTHYLLEGIREGVPLRDGAVWALDLAHYVSRKVMGHRLQRPYIQFKGNDFPAVWPDRTLQLS